MLHLPLRTKLLWGNWNPILMIKMIPDGVDHLEITVMHLNFLIDILKNNIALSKDAPHSLGW